MNISKKILLPGAVASFLLPASSVMASGLYLCKNLPLEGATPASSVEEKEIIPLKMKFGPGGTVSGSVKDTAEFKGKMKNGKGSAWFRFTFPGLAAEAGSGDAGMNILITKKDAGFILDPDTKETKMASLNCQPAPKKAYLKHEKVLDRRIREIKGAAAQMDAQICLAILEDVSRAQGGYFKKTGAYQMNKNVIFEDLKKGDWRVDRSLADKKCGKWSMDLAKGKTNVLIITALPLEKVMKGCKFTFTLTSGEHLDPVFSKACDLDRLRNRTEPAEHIK